MGEPSLLLRQLHDMTPSGRQRSRPGSMYMHTPLDHAQLLDQAHQALEAAHEHDADRVKANTLRLFDAMTEHLLAERPAFLRISPGDARVLRHGQQHIIDLLLALAASATDDDNRCGCERIADAVIAELTVQADDEHRVLRAAVR